MRAPLRARHLKNGDIFFYENHCKRIHNHHLRPDGTIKFILDGDETLILTSTRLLLRIVK